LRLAFLSPLPPAPTGIADYAAEVLHMLAPGHELEAFHAQERVDGERLPDACAVRPAREFLASHRERPFDVAVYQMGNGLEHAFLYDPLARVPGLLVLHDLVLFHSRARMLLDAPEVRAWIRDPGSRTARERARPALASWAAERACAYPAQAARLAAAHLGTVGDLLPYAYPMFRLPVETSRAVIVHNDFMSRAVREEVPEASVVRVPLPARREPVAPSAVLEVRSRLGFGQEDLVVGCFGLLTREKRIETVARAVARAAAWDPRVRLLLAGPVAEPERLERLLRDLGVRDRSVLTGRVPLADLPSHMEAADLAVHLRYPTARESSAALLRLLAQGRPTVVSDLEHLADVPEGAVARVDPTEEEPGVMRAILGLGRDAGTLRRLGEAAAAFAGRAHAPERTRAGYESALERARQTPDPTPRAWPDHWPRAEPTRLSPREDAG
jgi:glycosyltransferase involved in cell wall biosynthesis